MFILWNSNTLETRDVENEKFPVLSEMFNFFKKWREAKQAILLGSDQTEQGFHESSYVSLYSFSVCLK